MNTSRYVCVCGVTWCDPKKKEEKMVVPTTKIAAIAQLCSTSNKLLNLCNVAKCAGWAKKHGASMLFLPECFGFIGSNAAETLANAEEIPCSYGVGVGSDSGGYDDDDGDLIESNVNNNGASLWWHSLLQNMVVKSANPNHLFHQEDNEHEHEQQHTKNATNMEEENDSNNNNISILEGIKLIAKSSDLYISAGGMHELGAPTKYTTSLSSTSSSATGQDNMQDEETKEHLNNNNTNNNHHRRVYNTHVIIDTNGNVVTKYRKIHLFDVSIPSKGIHLCESNTTAPGNKLVVCDSPIGRLGKLVVYNYITTCI